MSQIVMCHGIGYQFKHRETGYSDWYKALHDSMSDACLPVPSSEAISTVFYGNCYRSQNSKGSDNRDELAQIPNLKVQDLTDPLEVELLQTLAAGVSTLAPDGKGLMQSALRRLEKSERLGRPPARLVLWLLRQVRRYLDPEDSVRGCAQQRFARVVTPDTRVVIAHSLGSVVAYEALCGDHPDWNIETFVTLGSPLGLKAVQERLVPRPSAAEGDSTPKVRRWVNVAASDDPIALVKELKPAFGDIVEDQLVVNTPVFNPQRYVLGSHSVLRYITTAELAEAVDQALSHEDKS
ncbi:hypothetical protein ACFQ05_31530 [Amycolatopsis umgeniensis]|uniref:Alpha/beta hydrolase n=1 Tax=Amycolatopsis umgeniensis TaxID=336628 RepID=A0A841BEL8_9PSEU|nr:hypothetical protein [Amycolatopsis umgeniensis]MBB5857440.1 hypothetical protein [Amycolatopsis umgeniensis]